MRLLEPLDYWGFMLLATVLSYQAAYRQRKTHAASQ